MGLQRSSGAPTIRVLLSKKFLLLLLLLQLPMLSVSAEAFEQNTAFLPLKIDSKTTAVELAKSADAGLKAALDASNLSMVEREKAQKMVDYNAAWPPTEKDLKHISLLTGMNNVAVGTLTVLGNRISIDFKVFDSLDPTSPTFYTRQAKSSAELPEALAGIVHDIVAYARRAFTIAAIAPEGNKNIDSGAILRKIKTKVGDLYNPEQLREDLKSIYQMGYFDDVQIDVKDSPNGKDVTFKVVEKPVITTITYSGMAALDEKDVKDAANLKEQGILNPAKINNAVESVINLYKSKGYYDTKVTSKITYPAKGRANVAFNIKEGKKIYIKEIRFHGNKTFESSDLEDVMKTGTHGFFSWLTEAGLLDMDELKQDADRIVAFYNNHGYLDAKISDPIITQDKEWLYITFDIDEGPRYQVGTIDFKGDLITDKQSLIDMMTIRKEKYLSRQVLRQDILKIQDFYSEKGYAFVEIRPDLRKSASAKRFDIVFNIRKGNLVYINRITIKGNNRTRDNVIRRELKIAEGGIFDSKALRTSTQKLQRLEFFEQVSINPEPAGDPSRVNIDIDVKEKSTGRFSIGAGYSSVDQVVLMGQISEDNFLGLGDRLAFSVNTGSVSRLFNLSFANPHVNDSDLSLGVDLFNLEREYDNYTKNSKGGSFHLGYPLWEEWIGIGSYSYTDTHLTDVTANAAYIIRASEDIHTTSAVKYALRRDVRDRLYGTTKGSYNEISLQYAGGPFGGDSQFTKLEGITSWYFPLFWGTVFHIRGSAGQAWEDETGKLPVYERFYLGGINTIRGFKYAKISPKDPETGDLVGGDKMWYSNTELLFPLVAKQGIQGVLFYDMGQVFNNDENWSLSDFRKSAGVGINWLSPIGPLRLVWGYNLDPLSGEPQSVWDFSIGGTF
jgi:outer membrane protein insertion porin family